MANLVIDIGNTLIKVAVFNQEELLYFGSKPFIDAASVLEIVDKFNVKQGIISSVRKEK